MATPTFLDLSTRLLAFYSTYVASQARGASPSLLQSLVEGEPAWDRLPAPGGEAGPLALFCGEISRLAATSPGRALAAVSSRLAVARVVDAFGTGDQKARWVEPLAAGAALGAYALSEPQSGSDATLVEARATPGDRGWNLTGRKVQVVLGAEEARGCDVVVVFAIGAGETEDERARLSAFLVPGNAPGISWTPRPAAGLPEARLADLVLDSVAVDRDAILGGAGAGSRAAQFLLDMVRVGTAATLIGALRSAEENARMRLGERRGLGHRLVEHDMVAERLVVLAERLHAMESLLALTVRLAEGGCDIGPEAAALKIFTSDTARAGAASLAELGGGGAAEGELAALAAAVQSLAAAGGVNDVARYYLALQASRRVGAWLLANARGRRGAGWLDAVVKRWWKGMRLALTRPRLPPPFRSVRLRSAGGGDCTAEVLGLWRECAGVTAERAFQVHDYFAEEIYETQFHLARLATMITETWALTAVLWAAPAAPDRVLAGLSPALRSRRAWRAVAYASSELFVGDAWEVEEYARGLREAAGSAPR